MTMSLVKALELKKFPNPLLLIGATVEDARAVAKRLLGEVHESKVDSGNHPDVHLLEPEGKSRLHPIASIHKLIQEMGLPPFEAGRKIFVIDKSDQMLPAAANALLKTLEEPHPDTFFILLSDHPDRLLPTVVSRLNPLCFSRQEQSTSDMSSFVALAQSGQWDQVLDALETLEEEDPGALFQSLLNLKAKEGDPDRFLAFSRLVSEGQIAVERNVRLKHVVLNLLIHYTSPHATDPTTPTSTIDRPPSQR